MIKSRHRLIFLSVLGLLVGGIAVLYVQHRLSNPERAAQESTRTSYPRHDVQIRGFMFVGHHEGRRLISIKADAFSVEKKKLGPFRFGPINVAKFRNAVIDIYGKRRDPVQKAAPESTGQRAEIIRTDVPPLSPGMTFKELFTRNALPPLPVKGVSSILIAPVRMNLHDDESMVTQISAASATISLRKRNILFEGNVRVQSGSKHLMTEQLVLFPENATLKTDRHFFFRTPDEALNGEYLTADISLTLITKDETSKDLERISRSLRPTTRF